MLFVPRFTSYRLQFISYLGVLRAIFLHFQRLTFLFFLDPACCWLNSCLQPWCRNITESYFIIPTLVNKERQRTGLNHRAQCCDEKLLTSPTHMQLFTVCLSPAAQVKRLTNEGCFRAHLQFKVSTWSPFASLIFFFFFCYKSSFGPIISSTISWHFLMHCPLSCCLLG